MSDDSNKNLASIHDESSEEDLTIGGPTAKAMGTEYQMISDAGRQALSPGETHDAQNVEQREDSGREPEYYVERQDPS